jgi:hypothetical protein
MCKHKEEEKQMKLQCDIRLAEGDVGIKKQEYKLGFAQSIHKK